MADILKTARPPKSNISKEERKALGELKKSKDLLTMGANIGKCTLVQCKVDYERKVNDILSDQNTYDKLSKHPTPKYKRKLADILQRLKTEDKIDESQYRLLYPTAETHLDLTVLQKFIKRVIPSGPL